MKAQIRYMYKVKSSQLNKVGYDPGAYYLAVEFKNLAVYGYKDVDHETFCRLVNAESIGVYFTDFIKDNHEFEKLRDAPGKEAKKPATKRSKGARKPKAPTKAAASTKASKPAGRKVAPKKKAAAKKNTAKMTKKRTKK